jgi:Protein of unknown function (DUF1176)
MRPFVYLTLTLSALFGPQAASAQSPAEPVLGKLVTKKDWASGCDNSGNCEAVALLPINATDNYTTLKLSRSVGDEYFIIQIKGLSGKSDRYRLFIDGRLADTGPIDPNSRTVNISNADALKVARLMARGKTLLIREATGALLGRISLAGSTAAMRHIDIQQGRAKSVSALVDIGRSGLVTAIQVPDEVFIKRIVPTADLPDTDSLVRLAEASPCAKKRSEVSEDSAYSLGMINGQAASLVLLNCGSNDFTVAAAAMIGFQQTDKSWKFEPAQFNSKIALTNDVAMPLLVNANWDQPSQTLSSNNPTRALKDCGTSGKYVWDGKSFRLILAEQMDECRGASDWITLWRAVVR